MIVCLLWSIAIRSGGSDYISVPAGKYHLGQAGMLDNAPRTTELAGFEISKYDVMNSDFAAFVRATSYVTDAEKRHDAMVFVPPMPEFRWSQDPSASWRFPNGKKQGGIGGKMNHPVTSISFHDAMAYCTWAGVRLPTLDEWEAACRAGTTTKFFFGEDEKLIGKYANIWHGRDHLKPDYSDGFMYTSPVGTFKPNPLGLYDMYGNVFQFCTGHMRGDRSAAIVHARGGSWWCSKNACCFFNSADVGSVNIRASFSNQGFRVVRLANR